MFRARRRSGAQGIWVAVSPLAVGGVVAVAGVVLANRNNWSVAAVWAIAGAATLAAITTSEFVGLATRRAATAKSSGEIVSIGARAAMPGESGPLRVLILGGHTRSGKGLIAQEVISRYPQWARLSCGDFVLAEAKHRGIPQVQSETDRLGLELVQTMGGEGFLEAVIDAAELRDNAVGLVIDDVYHVEVFDAIKQKWPSLTFSTVELPDSVRRDLLLEQGVQAADVDAVEHGALDSQYEKLTKERTPDRRVVGAREPGDAYEAIGELGDLLAA